jgi:hypothetical protein
VPSREPRPALYDTGIAENGWHQRIRELDVLDQRAEYEVHDFLEGRVRNGRSGDRDKYSNDCHGESLSTAGPAACGK